MDDKLGGYLLFGIFIALAIWLGEANWIGALLYSLAGVAAGITAEKLPKPEQRAS